MRKSELFRHLWHDCDALRGGMDTSQYKDYVLTLLFVRYVSDRYKGKTDDEIEVPEGASFDDLVALKGKAHIGDGINLILARLADANGLDKLPDFNDEAKLGKGREMVDRLSNLIAIFQLDQLSFGTNRAADDSLVGDAYEYLLRHFATESGGRYLSRGTSADPPPRNYFPIFDDLYQTSNPNSKFAGMFRQSIEAFADFYLVARDGTPLRSDLHRHITGSYNRFRRHRNSKTPSIT